MELRGAGRGFCGRGLGGRRRSAAASAVSVRMEQLSLMPDEELNKSTVKAPPSTVQLGHTCRELRHTLCFDDDVRSAFAPVKEIEVSLGKRVACSAETLV